MEIVNVELGITSIMVNESNDVNYLTELEVKLSPFVNEMKAEIEKHKAKQQ